MNFFSLFKRKILYKIKKKINIDLDNEVNKNTLDELFHYYGSDKANIFKKDKQDQGHGFLNFILKNLKHLKKKKLKF